MQKETIDKPYEELGFLKKDQSQIINSLNLALSSYQILFHKLQRFHWNVKGGEFYDVHEVTEKMYRRSLEHIDDIAERIRVFGKYPTSTLQKIEAYSIIEESHKQENAKEMIHIIIGDIEKMLETFLNICSAASAAGDVGTHYMIAEMVKELETDHWMLKSYAAK